MAQGKWVSMLGGGGGGSEPSGTPPNLPPHVHVPVARSRLHSHDVLFPLKSFLGEAAIKKNKQTKKNPKQTTMKRKHHLFILQSISPVMLSVCVCVCGISNNRFQEKPDSNVLNVLEL